MKNTSEHDLLIVQAYHPQKRDIGDFVYRIEQPAIEMGRVNGVRVINVHLNSPYFREFCLQADIVVWHLVSDQDALPLMEERKRRNLVNVYEISDNVIGFQAHDPMRGYFNDPVNLSSTFLHANLADAVQVTTEELVKRFGFLNPSFVVFENQIEDVGRYRTTRSNEMTIGWGGSLSHLKDLEWIAPSVVEFCRNHDNAFFSYMGAPQGFQLFEGIPEHQISFVEPGSIRDYYSFLETIDVGLAPLKDTEYNRCRSDIKFVEYASRGVIPVLSALSPYFKNVSHGETALLFSNARELEQILERLIDNAALGQKVADGAYRYVDGKRKESLHAGERTDLYGRLCKNRPSKSYRLDILRRLAPGSDSYEIKESAAEKMLSHGLRLYAHGDVAGEWKCYSEAIKKSPGYHTAHFWLGDSLFRHGEMDKAVRHLNRSIELNPYSLRSRLLLGLCHMERNVNVACGYFGDALQVSSRYAPAWYALGMAQENSGNYRKAVELFDTTLRANPFYSPAFLGLARCNLAQGKLEEAQDNLRIAEDVLPDDKVSRLHLAMLQSEIGKKAGRHVVSPTRMKESLNEFCP